MVEAVRSIMATSTYDNYEFVVVWDTGMDEAVLQELRELAGERLVLTEFSGTFNFPAKINRGAVVANGEYLLLLNDDVEVIDPDWLEVLLGLCQQDGVGMAGSLLLFEDGTIQHAGHLYEGGLAGHVGSGMTPESIGVARELHLEREVSGVTAACAMMSTDLFFQVGGMSTTLSVNYNDVDLCLKVRQFDKRIVVTPFARLYHFESKSRRAVPPPPYEMNELSSRWWREMRRDPYEAFPHRYP